MNVIALMIPAMHAYVQLDVTDADGKPIVAPDFRKSTEYADVAEAVHRGDTLDLVLHREDGTVVPTELVGIQDTDQLLATRADDDLFVEGETWSDDESLDDDLEDLFEIEADTGLCIDDDLERWVPDDELSVFPRYQIHVVLASDNAIP
jgi:hypothetical protein